MKQYNIVSLFTIIGFLFSCSNRSTQEYSRYSSFPKEIELKAEAITLDTAIFRYPFRLSICGDRAIIMDLHNTDYFFHAFSYPEWKHISSFGKRGNGPNEMLSADAVRFISTDSIYTLDANKMQIARWKLSIEKEKGDCTCEEIVYLDKTLVRTLDFYITDSCIITPDYLGEWRYRTVSHDGKPIAAKGKIPSERHSDAQGRIALAQAWRSFMDYSRSRGLLVLATQLGEVIELQNINNGKHIVIYGPNGEPEFNEVKGEGIPIGIMGFGDVKATDKYIYASFQGVSFTDKLRTYQKGDNPEDGGRYIYVFDFDGKPICKYILDRPIYGINIDEELGIITATCVESDQPILQFRIDEHSVL